MYLRDEKRLHRCGWNGSAGFMQATGEVNVVREKLTIEPIEEMREIDGYRVAIESMQLVSADSL